MMNQSYQDDYNGNRNDSYNVSGSYNFPPSAVATTVPQPSAPPMATSTTTTTTTSSIFPTDLNSYNSMQQTISDIPIATPVYSSTSTSYSGVSQSYNNQTYNATTVPSNRLGSGTRFQDGNKSGTYFGSLNSKGQRNGYGKMDYDDGSSYEGSWSANKKHGSGVLFYSSGPRLDGNWSNDLIHGPGTYYYTDGRVDLRKYKRDECVGEGVQFSADKRDTFLLNCGRKKKLISSAHASKIASKLGLNYPRA